MTLFTMSILGNLTYGASVILRFPKVNVEFYATILPFLFGSLGTLLFDICILIQSRIYATVETPDEEVEESYP